jgi:hypothetical protein
VARERVDEMGEQSTFLWKKIGTGKRQIPRRDSIKKVI